jgi:8-oxo-dGTP pyrophosphatase MutT (NUDIX family)
MDNFEGPEKVGAGLLFMYVPASLSCRLLAATSPTCPTRPDVAGSPPPLCSCQGEVLLLRRAAGGGNPCSLGLPGGNADPGDADLLATAVREAGEEMGTPLPPFRLEKAPVLTKRGKRLQKHYTVFLATLDPADRATWAPALNEEHSDFTWLPVRQAALRPDLHPVVSRVLREEPGREQVLAAAGLAQG